MPPCKVWLPKYPRDTRPTRISCPKSSFVSMTSLMSLDVIVITATVLGYNLRTQTSSARWAAEATLVARFFCRLFLWPHRRDQVRGCIAWLADLATYHKPDPFLKYSCNLRPTCEAIKTRRRSSRPIFQPKRQKAAPTSMKQAMLSAPCTICPASRQKTASPNPMIAPRMMVVPIK